MYPIPLLPSVSLVIPSYLRSMLGRTHTWDLDTVSAVVSRVPLLVATQTPKRKGINGVVYLSLRSTRQQELDFPLRCQNPSKGKDPSYLVDSVWLGGDSCYSFCVISKTILVSTVSTLLTSQSCLCGLCEQKTPTNSQDLCSLFDTYPRNEATL